MSILTIEEMREYIKRRLGAPITAVTISDSQFDDIIYDSVDIMSRYHYGSDATHLDFMSLDLSAGVSNYDLSGYDIQEVFDLEFSLGSSTMNINNVLSPMNALFYNDWVVMGNHPGSAGPSGLTLTNYQIQMDYVEQIQRYFCREYHAYWHFPTENIRVVPTPNQDMTVLLLVYKKSTVFQLLNNVLFKKLCVAKAMIQWSINVGKYDSPMAGGGKVNYERFYDIGSKMEEEVMDALLGESQPCDFFIA